MGRRSRKAISFEATKEPTAHREALELKWRDQVERNDSLALKVMSESSRHEPYHRWLHFRQGFSPSLVRLFLEENELESSRTPRIVLDPFSGSGTTVTECGRRGVTAIGVEALDPLVFLTNARWLCEFSPIPRFEDSITWQEIADTLIDDWQRAALMLAVGSCYTSAGKPNEGAPPLAASLHDISKMISTDLQTPLSGRPPVQKGDARNLHSVGDNSIDGILTSPPYLSRHDYTKIASPYEMVFRHWYGDESTADIKQDQITANPRAKSRFSPSAINHVVVSETCDWLERNQQRKLAVIVRAYFDDMLLVLRECVRVLRPGAVCWMVVGGARLKNVYVPADLVIADLAQQSGFEITSILAARDLIGSRRKFGKIGHLAPRESVLVMTKDR